MTQEGVSVWAEKFWRLVGFEEPFPRSLEAAIVWALPLAVVKLPRLGLAELHDWLKQRGVPFQCPGTDRRLRACLVAKAGRGLVFLDGTQPAEECRFSLAHEVAHFLCDYLEPRERALAQLGRPGLDVLDGVRPPTLEERLTGALRGVRLGMFTHLMDRSATGAIERYEVLDAEDLADRLALELLAPEQAVIARLADEAVKWRDPAAQLHVEAVLYRDFGLPKDVARGYGRMLVADRRHAGGVREWLGV